MGTKEEHFLLPSQAARTRRRENIAGHVWNGKKLPVFGNLFPWSLGCAEE
jgi:hypothetical protein